MCGKLSLVYALCEVKSFDLMDSKAGSWLQAGMWILFKQVSVCVCRTASKQHPKPYPVLTMLISIRLCPIHRLVQGNLTYPSLPVRSAIPNSYCPSVPLFSKILQKERESLVNSFSKWIWRAV